MNDRLLNQLFYLGKYSDLELTINEKLYKLHKEFLNESQFFKTLIENIGNMSTKEDINISDINGDILAVRYVDDIVIWLYTEKNDFMDKLNNENNMLISLREAIKYYYVADFLQIDRAKNMISYKINDILGSEQTTHDRRIYKATGNIYTIKKCTKKMNRWLTNLIWIEIKLILM